MHTVTVVDTDMPRCTPAAAIYASRSLLPCRLISWALF